MSLFCMYGLQIQTIKFEETPFRLSPHKQITKKNILIDFLNVFFDKPYGNKENTKRSV